jgi:hypothetical protein
MQSAGINFDWDNAEDRKKQEEERKKSVAKEEAQILTNREIEEIKVQLKE